MVNTDAKPKEKDHELTGTDLGDFFVDNLESSHLGVISHAHLAWADQEREGAKSPKVGHPNPKP